MFPKLNAATDGMALRFGDRALDYPGLAVSAGALAHRIRGCERVALWATSSLETAVGAVAALLAGTPLVPINPKSGELELAHIVSDSEPDLLLTEPGVDLPQPLSGIPRLDITIDVDRAEPLPPEPQESASALIVYTSGTTGPPKGAVLPRRAITATLDAVADAWEWTGADILVHGLPLFHVHGLVLGILGPLRRGGCVVHLGRFSTDGARDALAAGGTMLFGVPTMYHRIAETVGTDRDLSAALAGARLLVSGSAALSLPDHERITAATGQQVIERYGMTETLMNTSVRMDGVSKPGSVGVPLPGVRLRLVDDSGAEISESDGLTIGEIQVQGANVFTHYLKRPDATAAAFDEGWFRTGDMATRDVDGDIAIVGRKSTDLIKSGGFKIGAGEIENVLLDHPDVAEAAVTGEADADLGERIIAWIVAADSDRRPDPAELADHVASRLAPHKRPRDVRFVQSLPRNAMGKIMKRQLRG